MTPIEEARQHADNAVARADAAVQRAYTAAHAAQAHADAAGQEDKILNRHAYAAYDAAGHATDYRGLARSCAHYARHPETTDGWLKDARSADHHADQAAAYAAQAEKAQAAAAKRAARAARQSCIDYDSDLLQMAIG